MDIRDIIAKTGDLPSLPTIAARINSEMQSESLTAKSLGEFLSEDSSLVAKVLRLSNSAFYGMPKQVTSIEKAVMVLGFNAVKNLALGVSIYAFFKGGKRCTIDVQGLWNHSLGVAVSSRIIMARSNKNMADDAFLFGIVHDLGKVVMINADLLDMEKLLALMTEKNICQAEAEMEVFGFNHQKVGAALMREWNFPDAMVASVNLHHDLPPETKKLPHDVGQLVRVVCVANQMAKALSLGNSTNSKRDAIPAAMWKMLAIKRDDLPDLSKEIKKNYNDMLAAWNGNGNN